MAGHLHGSHSKADIDNRALQRSDALERKYIGRFSAVFTIKCE